MEIYKQRRELADDSSKGLNAKCPFEGLPMDKRSSVRMESGESSWPQMVEIPELKDEDPAVRKEAQIYSIVVNGNALKRMTRYHSSWFFYNLYGIASHKSEVETHLVKIFDFELLICTVSLGPVVRNVDSAIHEGGTKGGGVRITFHERKNSHFTFHR